MDTEQNTTVEDSGNKDTSETIDSEKIIKNRRKKKAIFQKKSKR